MEFHPENVDTFMALFYSSKPVISEFNGCREVELYVDTRLSNVYYTISKWDTEDDLDNYRSSAFFQDTWIKTKALFSAKPFAYSLRNAQQ
jgi:quinol monooxygenase YgiN